MTWTNGDHYCDHTPCGKRFDAESSTAHFTHTGHEYCSFECLDAAESEWEADRQAARADRIHDEAREP